VYSDGTRQYTVREINITEGAGYINTERTSGSGSSPASGSLTKISGVGDATLTYSSWTTDAGNPFWNAGALDFANYLTSNSLSMSADDWVFIHLGINDVFSSTSVGAQTTMIDRLRALITNMQSAVSGLRVAICVTIPPTISQDGFGANYSNGQTLAGYLANINMWQQRLVDEFDNTASRVSEIYLIPWNGIIDREYNFPQSQVDANSRNTTQITTWTNGVHPAQSGYNQMGDQLRAFIKYHA
jgi:lysophospholipase L1-like esterase